MTREPIDPTPEPEPRTATRTMLDEHAFRTLVAGRTAAREGVAPSGDREAVEVALADIGLVRMAAILRDEMAMRGVSDHRQQQGHRGHRVVLDHPTRARAAEAATLLRDLARSTRIGVLDQMQAALAAYDVPEPDALDTREPTEPVTLTAVDAALVVAGAGMVQDALARMRADVAQALELLADASGERTVVDVAECGCGDRVRLIWRAQ